MTLSLSISAKIFTFLGGYHLSCILHDELDVNCIISSFRVKEIF